MLLPELMKLEKLEKEQLIELITAFYALLMQRSPAVVYVPQTLPAPAPYVAPYTQPLIPSGGTKNLPYRWAIGDIPGTSTGGNVTSKF